MKLLYALDEACKKALALREGEEIWYCVPVDLAFDSKKKTAEKNYASATYVVVSRERLMEKLWQTDSFVDENTLSVNMGRLRKKLDAAGLTDFIETKFGVGYIVK